MSKNLGRIMPLPKGDYDSSLSYEILDMVKDGNASYIAKKNVPVGEVPSRTSEFWQILVDGEELVLPTATVDQKGIVKPDGTTILVDEDGTIHSGGSASGIEMTEAEYAQKKEEYDESSDIFFFDEEIADDETVILDTDIKLSEKLEGRNSSFVHGLLVEQNQAIKTINSDLADVLQWQTLAKYRTTGKTTINISDIPDTYAEIKIDVLYTVSSNLMSHYSNTITKLQLDASGNNSRIFTLGGHYVSASNCALCNINYSRTSISLRNLIINGTDMSSDAIVRVSYR